MANATTLSRAKPAFAVFVAAAAITVATLYFLNDSQPTEPAGPGLHRSNAVRRPRPVRNTQENVYPEGGLEGVHNKLLALTDDEKSYFEESFAGRANPTPVTFPIIAIAGNLETFKSWARDLSETDFVAEVTDEEWGHIVAGIQSRFLDEFMRAEFGDRPLEPAEAVVVLNFLLGKNLPLERSIEVLSRFTTSPPTDLSPNAVDAQLRAFERGPATIATSSDVSYIQHGNDPEQNLQQLVYFIAQERTRNEVEHKGVTCDQCGARPIRGTRYRCSNCLDFDLCSSCEAHSMHDRKHIFYKIKVPAPQFGYPRQQHQTNHVYPGLPEMMPRSMPKDLQKKIIQELKFTPEQLDGLWEQFSFLANQYWDADPNGVHYAINRRAFDVAMVPNYAHITRTPNILYDRMFAIMDSDHNDLIGCEEYLTSLSLVRSHDYTRRQKYAFQGFDIDDDNYITRKDCLRLFRAHYRIQREIAKDHIAVNLEQMSLDRVASLIESSQPLASWFPRPVRTSDEPERNITREKRRDRFGDPERDEPVLVQFEPDMDRTRFLEMQAGARIDQAGGPTSYLRRRHSRQKYYIDAEEGADLANGSAKGMNGNATASSMTGNCSPTSPSILDEIDQQSDVEQLGWEAYEIPQPEKDIGRDILYQITQEGFNELLDPLFMEGENLAIELAATKEERLNLRKHYKATDKTLFSSTRAVQGALQEGLSGFSLGYSEVLQVVFDKDRISRLAELPENERALAFLKDVEIADSKYAAQFKLDVDPDEAGAFGGLTETSEENIKVARRRLVDFVWNHVLKRTATIDPGPTAPAYDNAELAPDHDPTLPQFRPDSVPNESPLSHAPATTVFDLVYNESDSNDSESISSEASEYIGPDRRDWIIKAVHEKNLDLPMPHPTHEAYMLVAAHFRNKPHTPTNPAPSWRIDRLLYLDKVEERTRGRIHGAASISLDEFLLKCSAAKEARKPVEYMYFLFDLMSTTL